MTEQVIEAPAPAVDTPAPAPATVVTAPAPAPAQAAQAPAQATDATTEKAEAKSDAPKWSDNWRQELAGDDEKLLKRLERMLSPADLAKTIREQDKLISSGKAAKPLPKDATPEQVSEWREANGIPAKPEEYDTKLPDGLVFGEADKPAVDSYLKAMHGVNATPEQVKAGLAAYAQFREAEFQQLQELDSTEREATESVLREEWGGDFKRNINSISGLLDGAPTAVKEKMLGARAGKSALMNDPDVVRWLAQTARELNPTATIVPAGGNREGAIDEEIKSIESKMYDKAGQPDPAYWKDDKIQKRYGQLLDARSKLK